MVAVCTRGADATAVSGKKNNKWPVTPKIASPRHDIKGGNENKYGAGGDTDIRPTEETYT